MISLLLACYNIIRISSNIDERLFYKKHTKPENNSVSENAGDSIVGTSSTKQPSKSKSILPALEKEMPVSR
jgi:hypothetical protein